VVCILLSAPGIDVHKMDAMLKSPLDVAVEKEFAEISALLPEVGGKQ
jgi:hypothetical protein